jgi:hypothetical protein
VIIGLLQNSRPPPKCRCVQNDAATCK